MKVTTRRVCTCREVGDADVLAQQADLQSTFQTVALCATNCWGRGAPRYHDVLFPCRFPATSCIWSWIDRGRRKRSPAEAEVRFRDRRVSMISYSRTLERVRPPPTHFPRPRVPRGSPPGTRPLEWLPAAQLRTVAPPNSGALSSAEGAGAVGEDAYRGMSTAGKSAAATARARPSAEAVAEGLHEGERAEETALGYAIASLEWGDILDSGTAAAWAGGHACRT